MREFAERGKFELGVLDVADILCPAHRLGRDRIGGHVPDDADRPGAAAPLQT